MNRLLGSVFLFVAHTCCVHSPSLQASEPQIWQHIDGRTATAAFVRLLDNDRCLLRSPSGKLHVVEIGQLIEPDRLHIRRLTSTRPKLVSTIPAGTQEDFDLGSEKAVQDAFEKLAEQTGRKVITKTRLETRTRMMNDTRYECRCVCINGRWVWRWVPIQTQVEQSYTVEVPYQEVTDSRLIDGANWSKSDPEVGEESITVDLKVLPSSAGGRATRIILACKDIVEVTGAPDLFDTVAAMGSEAWEPVAGRTNIERAFQIKATVNPADYQTLRLEVLVRERNNVNLERSSDKTALNAVAETVATNIKEKLTKP